MKKITYVFMFALSLLSSNVFSQTDFITALPNNGGTSGNARSPQAVDRYDRSVWLITAAEMAASGFVTGNVINSIGFNLNIASNIPVTGTLTVYLQNSTDTANLKSTTWATAITGMTTASNSAFTIPNTVGTYDTPFSGGTAFTYNGGSIYVATDYQNPTGMLATTANSTLCNTALTGGLLGVRTATTTIPTTVAASNFRPETRLGKQVTCARPFNLAVTPFTTTTATLGWTLPPGGGTIEIENVAYDLAPTGTPTTVGLTSSTFVQTGLTASTAYKFYARTNCGAGLFSSWNGPFAYNTVFSAATPPYTTGFELEALKLIDWSTIAPATPSDWTLNFYTATSGLTQAGVGIIQNFSSTTAVSNNYIFSRGVNLNAGSPATVSYYVRNYVDGSSTNIGNLSVTTGNDRTIAAQTTVVGSDAALAPSTTFVLKTYNFTPTFTGTHYFALRNQSPANITGPGNHALLVDTFTVTQTLKTDEFLATKFSVFPNPATNLITISSTIDAAINAIEITDLNGRVVKVEKMNGLADAQISIGDLSQGIYMMKITSDKGTATKKVVKE